MNQPLYVSRKLINADDLINWAKANGFTKTVPPDQMHVTLVYSKTPVDWSQFTPHEGRVINLKSDRSLKHFDKGAVVLTFDSEALKKRHQEFMDGGASFDYDEYTPHVTISYEGNGSVDPKPYSGELIFGPEIFEPLDTDWSSKIKEQ